MSSHASSSLPRPEPTVHRGRGEGQMKVVSRRRTSMGGEGVAGSAALPAVSATGCSLWPRNQRALSTSGGKRVGAVCRVRWPSQCFPITEHSRWLPGLPPPASAPYMLASAAVRQNSERVNCDIVPSRWSAYSQCRGVACNGTDVLNMRRQACRAATDCGKSGLRQLQPWPPVRVQPIEATDCLERKRRARMRGDRSPSPRQPKAVSRRVIHLALLAAERTPNRDAWNPSAGEGAVLAPASRLPRRHGSVHEWWASVAAPRNFFGGDGPPWLDFLNHSGHWRPR